MGLRDYVRIARQRWMTIVIVTLLAIGAAAAITLRTTPQYAASATLFISTPQSGSDQAYSGGLFSQARVASYADLLTREEISRRVVDKLNLQDSPQELSKQIKALAKPETVVLTITVTDSKPERAQLLAQTVSEEFVVYVKELETPDGKTIAPVKASIVDRATEPDGPVTPKPVRNFALAAILGLLLGAGIAVLRDTFDTTIKTVDDLDTATGSAPLLGNIHFDKNAPKNPLITSLSSHAPRAESFRVLRTNLQFVNVDTKGKVYVVTSSVPGEGKSTTAANLALTIAHSGQSVILLEGDLRRPKAISYLQLEGSVGVTTVLVGRIELSEAIQNRSEGFDVLAAGSTPPNPAELLQSQGMKRVIAKLRKDYGVVLIDAPPLLPVVDAAVLAAESDGAILVVHHGKTTRDQVAAAAGRLESVDARLIGTVLNMSPVPKRGKSGYGYGYAPETVNAKSGSSNLPKGSVKSKRKFKVKGGAQHFDGEGPPPGLARPPAEASIEAAIEPLPPRPSTRRDRK